MKLFQILCLEVTLLLLLHTTCAESHLNTKRAINHRLLGSSDDDDRHDQSIDENNADNDGGEHDVGIIDDDTPIESECGINDEGNFGIVTTDGTTGIREDVIPYKYQVETVGGVTGDEVKQEVEEKFSNFLLEMYGQECSRRRLEERVLVGFSTSPNNRVTSEDCVNGPQSGDLCSVVTEEFSIYTVNRTDAPDGLTPEEALQVVIQTMDEQNKTMYLTDTIVNITYVAEPDPVSDGPTRAKEEIKPLQDTDGGGGSYGWTIGLSVGAAGIVGAALYAKRRHDTNRKEQLSKSDDLALFEEYDMNNADDEKLASRLVTDDVTLPSSIISDRKSIDIETDEEGNIVVTHIL